MKTFVVLLAFGLAAPEKLDRTYLPPPGSKYSGGSPGDLQVPLEYPKERNTTATPVKPGLYGHQITSPDDTQIIPGFQRYPGPSYQGSKDIVPVTPTNRPFNYNVPTTTTSYAFTQTTTFPPIEGIETTISPTAQGFPFDGSLRPQPGIVNQPFNQGQNYPQFPGIILPNTNIPGSKTTVSGSQTVTGQPDYNLVQNQYQQSIPSSTVTPNMNTQPGVPIYNQGYTQHLGVQPPLQFVYQGNIATPTPFPGYSSNIPLYQNTSFFHHTNSDGISKQLGQQPLENQGNRLILPSSNLHPGLQYDDKYGTIQSTEIPKKNTFPQPGQYQGLPFGTQDAAFLAPAPYDQKIYSTPSVITPTNPPSQLGSQNNLALNQKPYPITGIQGIPGSFVTQQQGLVPQYGFQPGSIPSTGLPQTTTVSDVSGQAPLVAKGAFSSTNIQKVKDVPGSISLQELNQPSFGQQLQVPGTHQELPQQQGGQLSFSGQQGYPTSTVAQRQQQGQIQLNGQQGFPTSHLRPGQQPQYGNQQDIYPSNIPQEIPSSGILNKQPQITGQQGLVQGSNLQQGPSKVGSQINDISGITTPGFNVQPGQITTGKQQTPIVQPIQQVQQQNLGVNNQPQFMQYGTKIPQQYTTTRPGSLNAQNLPGFTDSSTSGYGQPSIPTSPTSTSYSTSQGTVTPSSALGYPNVQETMSTVTIQPRPVGPQGEADRNAEILNYHNFINPEGYSYNFETSNGIHVEENGTTIDGTRANGSYSYIGDDGKLYQIDYSADENGFRPRGEHIPTPPPVPEAIQRVIEQAEKDRKAGVSHDGFYDHSRYGPKRYQKHKHRHPFTHEVENQTNISGEDLSDHDTRFMNEDKKQYRTQPGRNLLIKNNDGSLDDLKIDDNNSDFVEGSKKTSLRPQFTKLPKQKYNDVADNFEEKTETGHKQLEINKNEPISTSFDVSRRQQGISVGKKEKQVNRYKPRLQYDDYDFLAEDDFDQISSLEKEKNGQPSTFKHKDSEKKNLLDGSIYKTQGIKQAHVESQPSTTSKYDKNLIPKEYVDYGESDLQQYPGRRPSIFRKPHGQSRPVTNTKYIQDAHDEEKQTGHQPSFTQYEEDSSDENYKEDNKLQRPVLNGKPQGTRRPSTYTKAGDSDMSDNQDVRQKKPSKDLYKRPQDSRHPSIAGSLQDYVDDHTYGKYEQNRRPVKPGPFKKLGVMYAILEHSDKHNEELEMPRDETPTISGRPNKPTSTRRPGYDDARNKHTGQARLHATPHIGNVGNIDYFDVSTSERGKPLYEQDFGNKDEYPQQVRDEETGYQYTRPQNIFEQVTNKFPSRLSDKVQEGATRRPFTKYDIEESKTTVQPFITPNVSRDDDKGYEDSSEEKLPVTYRKPGTNAPQKVTTSIYDDYRTADNGQEELDIDDEEIAKLQPERPRKIGFTRRPITPEYDNESFANNDKNLRPKDTFRPSQNGKDRYPADHKKNKGWRRTEPGDHQSTNPDYMSVSSTTQASRRIFRPGTKQPSGFYGDREGGSPYSTTLSPSDTTETEAEYIEVTTPTGLSTLATRKPSRPGSYSEVTQPSTNTPSFDFKLTSALPTSQTVYDYTDGTTFPGSPNIRPGISESVSQSSPERPSTPGYYSKNTAGSEVTAPVTVNQTGIPPEGYYQVTGPTYKPQGDIYPNAGIISAITGSRPGLQDLPSTTYRPNYFVTDVTRPTQLNIDAFGRPISGGVTQPGYVTSGQNVPLTGNTVYQDTRVIRPDLPSSIFNAGESRFGVTTSAPGPKPTEFGPSSITTPGYLGPKSSVSEAIDEDFRGPKQPQRFDPNTGYYY